MAEETNQKQRKPRTGMQVFFIYDLGYCRHEADDPKNAILYFNPPKIPDAQKCALCCQLMGTVQFFSSCFSPPKLLNMQKGKFAIRTENNYIMALGGSKDMPDSVLDRQMNELQNLFRFYYKSIYHVEKSCENRLQFLQKMNEIWDCCLKQSQYDGDALSLTFSAVPQVNLAKNSKGVFKSSLELLQICQKKCCVIAGCVFYQNQILTTQVEAELTHRLLMIHPFQRDNFNPEALSTDSRLPPGVRMFNVYVTWEELQDIFALNKHTSSYQQHLNDRARAKGRKRQELRSYFSEAPSSDELSTVTEESVDNLHLMCPKFSESCSELDESESKLFIEESSRSTHDYTSEEDSGQSEKSDVFGFGSMSDNAMSVLKDVAKKSYLSSNKIRDRTNRDKNLQLRRNHKRNRAMNDSSKVNVHALGDDKRFQCDSPLTLLSARTEQKPTCEIRRSMSESTFDMLNGPKKCRPEVMSEDSSYYSNEPSPTLGRKAWKYESDLTAPKTNHQNWEERLGKALNALDSNQTAENQTADGVQRGASKPPLRRKLSTVMGPQIQKLKNYPASFSLSSSLKQVQDNASEIFVIAGNKISEKVSWSSSGYETNFSGNMETTSSNNTMQEKACKNNPQMLPNGKIVPIELQLLTATKERDAKRVDIDIDDSSKDFKHEIAENSDETDSRCSQSEQFEFKKLQLYVQSHSETMLLLLLHEDGTTENSIQSLWRTGLAHLGDISVEVHKSIQNYSRKDSGRNHKYLRFNAQNNLLSGDSLPLNLNDSSDKMLNRVTQLMHEEFLQNKDISDLTIALRDTMIHGHLEGNKETYYQQRRMMELSREFTSLASSTRSNRSQKRLESNFGSFLL